MTMTMATAIAAVLVVLMLMLGVGRGSVTAAAAAGGDGGHEATPGTQGGPREITSKVAFDNLIRENTPAFVKFYAPWCGHCKRLAPTWGKLARELAPNPHIVVVQVDCTQHDAICAEQGVRGYPTLRFYAGNGDTGITYTEGRSLEALTRYVAEQLAELVDNEEDQHTPLQTRANGQSLQPEMTPDGALLLQDESQLEHLLYEDQTPVFAMFMTSWCAHCRAAKPAVMALARQIREKGGTVAVAVVDCEDNSEVCKAFDVRAYPTFKLFVPGATPVAYTGRRRTRDFAAFIAKHTPGRGTGSANEDAQASSQPQFEKTEEGVVLTGAAYKKGTALSSFVIVRAYVPWCGHSQRMAPAWKELVSHYSDSDRITLAQVDCSKHPAACQEAQVQGYPQITAYRFGRKFRVFSGRRTFEEMKVFVDRVAASKPEHRDEL